VPVAPPLLSPPPLPPVATLPPEPLDPPFTTLLLESPAPLLRLPPVDEDPPDPEPIDADEPPLLLPPCPPEPLSGSVSEEHAIPIAKRQAASAPDQAKAERPVRAVGGFWIVLIDGLESKRRLGARL
jgi:hypothetical protein